MQSFSLCKLPTLVTQVCHNMRGRKNARNHIESYNSSTLQLTTTKLPHLKSRLRQSPTSSPIQSYNRACNKALKNDAHERSSYGESKRQCSRGPRFLDALDPGGHISTRPTICGIRRQKEQDQNSIRLPHSCGTRIRAQLSLGARRPTAGP